MNFPKGKYLATIKIGPKGQIVIPKEVREMFKIKTGDSLLLMADQSQGIGIQPFEYAEKFWKAIEKEKNKNK